MLRMKTWRILLSMVLAIGSISLMTAFRFPAKEPHSLHVQLLGINDFHGQLDKTNMVDGKPVGTAAVLAAYLKKREQENPNTLLVQAGDMVGASAPVSALLQDEPTIRILNALGFDAGTIGNHEFDEGIPEMMRLIYGGYHEKTGDFEGASFPYTCANVLDKQTHQPILPPYTIKRVKGIPIGFIGVVSRTTPSIVISDHVKDVEFIDEATAVNRWVKVLKQKGVHTIIVLAHEGGNQNRDTGKIEGPIADIARKIDPEVDVIFAGHTHTYLNGTVAGKLIVQAYSYGTAFSDVDLTIDPRSKDVTSKHGEIVTTYQEGIKPDPQVAKMVAEAEKKVGPLINQVIGKTAAAITRTQNEAGESALGNLIADAQRSAMNTDFAFMNPGGIRADLPAGDVTWGDLYTTQPFGNQLEKMELTGEQIKQLLNQQFQDPDRVHMLQISGLKYRWDPSRPADDRIVSMTGADGTPIDLNQTYTVTTNNFLASGGDRFTVFTGGKNVVIGPTDLDALIQYIKQLPQPFHAEIEGRIQSAP
ncbi:5'-nucleotidase C-terminal domain-containing protein [Thermoactinomyces sp. CICC 10523]|uniref:bifunctional metallophosphatase/5'-nucleotidase n=1 Tax=Thermoactinomyces sp. CICC 10523 TaxID=2767428 RepID=UPI0018DE4B69|nr:5'-nucleotidase C-terminal domain-containing protein [Thermoactinomyces sp. CICC 10523]